MKLSAYKSHFELTDTLPDSVRIYDLVVIFQLTITPPPLWFL